MLANSLTNRDNPLYHSIEGRTTGTIFLGTPMSGSDDNCWVEMGKRFLAIYPNLKRNQNAIDLGPKAARLRQIVSEFTSLVGARSNDRYRTPFQARYISEGQTMPKNPFAVIVESEMAAVPGVEPDIIDANHLNICKFVDNQDPGYVLVAGMIESIIAQVSSNDNKTTVRIHLFACKQHAQAFDFHNVTDQSFFNAGANLYPER